MSTILLVLGCAASPNTGVDPMPSSPPESGDTSTVVFDPLAGIGEVTLVADGFVFTEGPTWRAAEGVLLFTDIPENRIHQLTPPDTVEVFVDNSQFANGLDSALDGTLLVAQHDARRVAVISANGTESALVETYQGQRFNSPNDLAVRSDGTLYFTDPPYGLANRPREIDFNGLFRLAPGATEPVAEYEGDTNTTRPNGVVLSPDESTLYLADTIGPIWSFDVAADGSLSNPQVFADDLASADGMAIDSGGNLFVTARTGVRVYAPDGSLWGVIEVPDQPANCAFGDEDRRSLYITARERLYRVRTAQPGLW